MDVSLESCSGNGQLRIDTVVHAGQHLYEAPFSITVTDTAIMASLSGMATGMYSAKQNIETKATKSGSNGKIRLSWTLIEL